MSARVSRPRGPSRFTQADLTRAMLAAKKADFPVAAIRVEPDGSILIIPGTPQPVATSEEVVNDFDAKWGM